MNNLPRKIFYNTLAQSVGKIFALTVGLFTIGLLTRNLGESGFGAYSTVLAFMGLIVVFADLGLYLVVVREISKNSNNQSFLGNALGLRLTTAIASLLIGLVIAWLLPYSSEIKETMVVAVLAFLFVSLNQVLIGIFQKHLAQYLVVISEILGRSLNLLLVWIFITHSFPLPFFVLAITVGNGLQFVCTYLMAKKFEPFTIRFDYRVWKTILKNSWPLAFAVILNLIYFKTDTIFLSLFHSQETVGVYSLPYKIIEVLLAFPAMFVGLVMPLLSKFAFADWKKFNQILQNSFNALAIIVVPVLMVSWVFSQDIINLIKGSEASYLDSPKLLSLLVIGAAFIFFGTLYGYAVVAVNQQKPMIKGYLIAAIVGLVLYITLIPKLSYWGAAIGTIVTEAIVFIAGFYFVQKINPESFAWSGIVKLIVPSLGLLIFFYALDLNWIIETLLGSCLYLVLAFMFKAIPSKFVTEIFFLKRQNQQQS